MKNATADHMQRNTKQIAHQEAQTYPGTPDGGDHRDAQKPSTSYPCLGTVAFGHVQVHSQACNAAVEQNHMSTEKAEEA